MGEAKVVVIGAGSAGLAVSRELGTLGVDHTVLERSRVASSWRSRWDSFCLNTPAWTLSLPGRPYAGDAPQSFLGRDAVVHYLEAYAAEGGAQVETGVEVRRLERDGAGFRLHTDAGDLSAGQVVVCTGAFQRPHHPVPPSAFPAGLPVLGAEEYRRPGDLPPGRVLIAGSGQTGCQIAEDLLLAGREVAIACGRAPWGPRRLAGLDIVDWLARAGWWEHPPSSLPSPAARLGANVLVSGFAGGHDLNYRTLHDAGVRLLGHLRGVEGGTGVFAADVDETVAFSDERYRQMCGVLRDRLPAAGFECPPLPEPEPFHVESPTHVPLRDFGSVVLASGYRPDYSWMDVPGFDELGFPVTVDGASQAVAGLYFCGVHFLRTRKSSLLFGVGEDAAVVARTVAAGAAAAAPAG